MLPPDWEELAPLLDAVLEAPLEQRPALLLELSRGNTRRHSELQRMVAECERASPLLDRPAVERFAALFDDESDIQVPKVLGGRYHIDRELGRGGMAHVYLAHDVKHARLVAVKVIRPDLAISLGRERFLRETAIAARLRHPNIVPLYDSGDADGMLYFVMPYEDGPSLRARLSSGAPLALGERISILRDLARALAYAHERGVVHRDVKPDNVMLSGGAAVVTDFGIAKAVSVAQGSAGIPVTVTNTGVGIGTPAYMAPEQAVGDPSTDHRADIYSFGCVAYELFAGRPPFHGMSPHQLIAAQVGTKPTPVQQVSRDVPAGVAALIDRCLEKSPDSRPQSAHDLLAHLEGTSPTVRPSVPRRHRSSAAIVAFVAAGALLVVLGGLLVARTRGAAPRSASPRTVAVLPLVSSGGDSLQQELANGLSDEIAISLFKVAGLRVVSRRGATNYRGRGDVDPIEIGKQLGARYLVKGSMREANGRLVVLAQLLDATDGTMLWSDRIERGQSDLGGVRDDIARAVGDTLRRLVGVSGARTPSATSPAHPVDPEAYRLYVLAQRALTTRARGVQASIQLFTRATELDTSYAKAYAGLSLALVLSPYFQPDTTAKTSEAAMRAAERALRLDSSLAQPHIALGLAYQFAYDWERAEQEYRTALALDPHDVEALLQYGRHLVFRDRAEEALGEFLLARNEEPASAVVSSWMAYTYYLRGQLDSALVESARAMQSDPNSGLAMWIGAEIRLKAGQPEQARRIAQRLPTNTIGIALYVLAAVGDSDVTALGRALERARPRLTFFHTETAQAMLGVRDTAAALSALEEATVAGESWPNLLSIRDPLYDQIRGSPRFERLLRRVGLH